MEDYFSQTLQLITNVNRLQDSKSISLFCRLSEAVKALNDHCCGITNAASNQKPSQESKRITDYDYFITAKAKRRKPSALREISKFRMIKLLKNLCISNPNNIAFSVGTWGLSQN
jgi:hypothetical protein